MNLNPKCLYVTYTLLLNSCVKYRQILYENRYRPRELYIRYLFRITCGKNHTPRRSVFVFVYTIKP